MLGEGVLREIGAMKDRIENEVVRAGELDRNVKLGRGGIREIEFVAQTLQLLHEMKAQGARVIALANAGDRDVAELVTDCVPVQPASEYLLPIAEVIPLQLLAYHIAVARGCDIDKPRNLAKSVTVE